MEVFCDIDWAPAEYYPRVQVAGSYDVAPPWTGHSGVPDSSVAGLLPPDDPVLLRAGPGRPDRSCS